MDENKTKHKKMYGDASQAITIRVWWNIYNESFGKWAFCKQISVDIVKHILFYRSPFNGGY